LGFVGPYPFPYTAKVTTNAMTYSESSVVVVEIQSCAAGATGLMITHSLEAKYEYNIGDPAMVINLNP
jgi:hypothetical protein